MPKFTVTVGRIETNCVADNATDAIARAVEKLVGRGHGFHVNSDQFYANPETTTLHGNITKAAKGGGAHVLGRVRVSVTRVAK